jgi:general secretion pathway protein A
MGEVSEELRNFRSWASGSALLDYYKLCSQPFGVTPDPRYLYLSSSHRRALGSLAYGLEAARGLLGLIAAPGLGKTTLLFLFLRRLERYARTAFVFQKPCDPREFLLYLLADLGIDMNGQDLTSMQQQVRDVAMGQVRAGRRLVVVIDEAQNLESSVLETVLRLPDCETPRAGCLQVLISGQPQLAGKLAQPAVARLLHQASILTQLDPLSAEESDRYIDHRLRMAGHRGDLLFTSDARAMIARCSGGVPREINNICFNALIRGYARKRDSIDSSIVKDAVAYLELDESAAGSPHTLPPVLKEVSEAKIGKARTPQARFARHSS